jgi:Restriction endonuclease S subunits
LSTDTGQIFFCIPHMNKNTHAWEQRRLGDIGTVEMCRRIFKEETSPNGDIPFYKIGTFGEEPDAYISRKQFNDYKMKYSYPEIGDILISASGTIGRTVIYTGEDAYYQDSNIVWFNARKTRVSNAFLQHFYEIVEWSGIEGTTIKRLYNSNILNTKISLPSLPEQTSIGTFFRTLDDTITLHKRKLDKLKELKKGYLQQMFPQAGETVPRVRFAGFTELWEKRKLGEMAKIVRGASPRPIGDPKWFDNDSEIGWLRISDVTEQDGRIYYLAQRISEEGQKKTRVLTEPHLLLSIAATVGKPVINFVKTGVHDGFLIFQAPKFNCEFMFWWLEMYHPKWSRFGQPGSQVNLNSDLVKETKIRLPCLPEQTAIGNFFLALDKQITAQQAKLAKLKQLKSAYLQKMFI